ncbi:MAG: hypothetical protein HQK79_21145 [Desulfobacterales bacterium]|nr:hypothetical protein [Desulfobacterales bacterium]
MKKTFTISKILKTGTTPNKKKYTKTETAKGIKVVFWGHHALEITGKRLPCKVKCECKPVSAHNKREYGDDFNVLESYPLIFVE